MIPRKKNAVPTISFVRRLPYLTCMKNRTTSVALKTAIARATGKFRLPRSFIAANTVSAVHTISAPKIVTYVDVGEMCPDMTLSDGVRTVHEIQQREQEDPDDIDEVPVETAELDGRVPLGREAFPV